MFLIPVDDEQHLRVKPMNCPGHMLLFGSQLRSYRDLPIRYSEAAPLHRNELAGALHGLTRVRYVTQDDAHIFCTQEQIPASSTAVSSTCGTSTHSSGSSRTRSCRRDPTTSSAPTRSGTSRRASCSTALDRHEIAVLRRRGRGLVLRTEDRSSPHRRTRPQLAARDDPARRADAGTVRAHVHGPRQPEHASSSSTERCSARSSASSGSSIEHYARRFPVLALAGAGAGDSRRGVAPQVGRRATRPSRSRGLPRRGRRARRHARQAHPRRRDREGAVRRRVRRPRVGRRRSRSASAAANSRPFPSTNSWCGSESWPQRPIPGRCYDPRPASRSSSLPHLPGLDSRRFNRAGWTR